MNGSTVVAEKWTEQIVEHMLVYVYDEFGAPIAIQYRNTNYLEGDFDIFFLERNMFGDIIGIYNEAGERIGVYSYDAWGLISSSYDHANEELEYLMVDEYNPFGYRGYFYDIESNLYYLQSRYYSPTKGRFINADAAEVITATPMGLTDKNLFAYCDNNPVMRTDEDGRFWHIVAGAAIGGLIGGISSIVGQVFSGQEINWGEVGVSAAAGAVAGSITAAVPGMGAVATGLVQGTVSAASYVGTELVNGRDPTMGGTLASGITGGLLAGGLKAVGNAFSRGLKIEKVGRLEASNHIGDSQLGIKYQINKPNGRATTRSIEFHYNHSHKGYRPHWQQNSWNPQNNSVSSVKHWSWWGKRI